MLFHRHERSYGDRFFIYKTRLHSDPQLINVLPLTLVFKPASIWEMKYVHLIIPWHPVI